MRSTRSASPRDITRERSTASCIAARTLEGSDVLPLGNQPRRAVADAAARRVADQSGDARRRARTRPRGRSLRRRRVRTFASCRTAITRRSFESKLGADAPALSRGADRVVRWHRRRRARRVRAIHNRTAARLAGRIPRADVRRRHSAQRSRGGDRPARRTARARRDCALDQLARRCAVGRRSSGNPGTASRDAGPRGDRAHRRRRRSNSRSTTPSRRSRRGSRWCSTTASGYSAAGSSSVVRAWGCASSRRRPPR